MAFWKQTIRDHDIHGKRVLVRADYNVPIDENGTITDDYRIKESIPTLQYALEQACSIVIISHLGRPKGVRDSSVSLRPVAKRLSELFNREIKFTDDCVGQEAKDAVAALRPGDILLLENLRYHEGEESNDDDFAKQLAEHGEVFIQDGFGVVHRAHASTDAITRHISSVGGLLLEREVNAITGVLDNPQHPVMAIVGGAKVSDKIGVLRRFIQIADIVVIGGAMANVFLHAKGIDVAKSLLDKEDIPLAMEILEQAETQANEKAFTFYIPQDSVVADKIDKTAHTRIVDWGTHVIADIEEYPKRPNQEHFQIKAHEMILDIGPYSAAFISGAMQLVQTVVWNGAMGVTETKGLQGPIGPFSHGTETVVDSMLGQFGNRPYSLIGGGDTVAYVQQRGLVDVFDHVSTGGGATLELLSGSMLPGVEVLRGKD